MVMTRIDRETGDDLVTLLRHTVSKGGIKAVEIYEALGISSATYYRRITEDDFPTEEEIDLLVEGLKLEKRYGLTADGLKARFRVVTYETLEQAEQRVKELRRLGKRESLDHPPLATAERGRAPARADERLARMDRIMRRPPL